MPANGCRRLAASAMLLLGAVPAVSANLVDVVNGVRFSGCATAAVRAPLRQDARLDGAADLVSQGRPLADALAARQYPAAHSSAIHLAGAVSATQVAQVLRRAYCSLLSDADFRELGVWRRGSELWMVLAAPLPLPAEADRAAVERDVLRFVNAARAVGRRCGNRAYPPAGPLTAHAALARAAAAHSQDMASTGTFDHRGHDGSTPVLRVERAGYGPYRLIGENIAAGSATAADVVQGWLASPEHCQNIMDPRFTDSGVAFSIDPSNHEAIFWTQDFAAPAAAVEKPANP